MAQNVFRTRYTFAHRVHLSAAPSLDGIKNINCSQMKFQLLSTNCATLQVNCSGTDKVPLTRWDERLAPATSNQQPTVNNNNQQQATTTSPDVHDLQQSELPRLRCVCVCVGVCVCCECAYSWLPTVVLLTVLSNRKAREEWGGRGRLLLKAPSLRRVGIFMRFKVFAKHPTMLSLLLAPSARLEA